MRSGLVLSAVVVAAVIALRAQTPVVPPDHSRESADSCSVSGRVVTAGDQVPLKSAHVLLILLHAGRDRHVYGATTDSNGVFILKAVVPGRYKFVASHPGYVTQEYQAQGGDSGAPLSLEPKHQESAVLFRLTPSASITGYITDEDNQPAADIQVIALRRPSEEERDDSLFASETEEEITTAGDARTDDRGAYRIFGLKAGDYYLKATETMEPRDPSSQEEFLLREALGHEYASVYYPGVLPRSQAEKLSLRPGEEARADFFIHHAKTVELAGRVLSADGKPANAGVRLIDAGEDSDSGDVSASTDADGNFKLKGVPPGNFILMAQQQGADQVYRSMGRQKIQVGNDNIDSIVIQIGHGTDLTGHVRSEARGASPPTHIFVSLRSMNEGYWPSAARVKEDGSFDLKGLEDGDYAVMVHLDEGWYMQSAHLGQDDVLAEGLHLEKGTGGTLEILISASAAHLDGYVVRGDKAAMGAHVRISPDPETRFNRIRRAHTTTDQNGYFAFYSVAPGKYCVTAKLPAHSGAEAAHAEPQFMTFAEREHKSIQLSLTADSAQ